MEEKTVVFFTSVRNGRPFRPLGFHLFVLSHFNHRYPLLSPSIQGFYLCIIYRIYFLCFHQFHSIRGTNCVYVHYFSFFLLFFRFSILYLKHQGAFLYCRKKVFYEKFFSLFIHDVLLLDLLITNNCIWSRKRY